MMYAIEESTQIMLQRQLADKITNYASVDEIRMLLVCGAKANVAVTRGLTPLHYACFINYFAAAKLLLVRGAKADAVDEIGCSALHLCAEHGYYRMIKLLLQYMQAVRQYEVPVQKAGERYPIREHIDEPLRLAVKNGHYECARLLLENGANPNAIYFEGPEITHISPLDTNFLRLLLEYGADPSVFDRKGLTTLMRACRLKEKGIEAVQLLLDYGADINAEADERQDRRTALHYAVLSGSHQLVRFLIQKGARVNMPKEYSKPSVLDIAVLKDDPALLKIVLDAGADPHIVHTYIGSAMHLACCSLLEKQYDICKLLLDAGGDVNIQHTFEDGSVLKSPFVEYFRSRDHTDPRVLSLLLSYGGRVILRSPLADTRGQLRNIMRIALAKKQPEVVAMLLSLGEECDLRTVDRLAIPNEIKDDIIKTASNPPSLQQLTRLFIRRTMRPFSPAAVSALGLPWDVSGYLLGLFF